MKCSECGSTQTMNTGKEVICKNCGLILEEDFLEQPFLSDADKERAKHPSQLSAGTGTIKGKIFKNSWFEEYSEKASENYTQRIIQMGEKVSLPKPVIEDAIQLSERLFHSKSFKGKASEEILASCLYASALNNNQVRTHVEMEFKLGVNKYALLRSYKYLVKTLKLEFKRQLVPDLLEIFCNRLKLPPIYSFEAIKLWEDVKHEPQLQSKQAYVIASALIYRVASVSQREIAFVTGVHEPSMRKVLKLI